MKPYEVIYIFLAALNVQSEHLLKGTESYISLSKKTKKMCQKYEGWEAKFCAKGEVLRKTVCTERVKSHFIAFKQSEINA